MPVEWFALSAGAKIAMDSGTENMDWIAAVLRRIVEFTQAGGEINVVVTGINVGAQPYWNAEATMLMHTRGILVMTPEGAMVLTGKQALDYSGGVSAEDNFGIGGYERIMGPNGQAQYWAPDLAGACAILLAHYEHTYVAPGERFPRRASTADPLDRDVRDAPHHAPRTRRLRDGRRRLLRRDQPGPQAAVRHPQRHARGRSTRTTRRSSAGPAMRGAETAVVWDAHLGGRPVTLLGIESQPLPRHGVRARRRARAVDARARCSRARPKKVARAINAASGRRPVVVLANLAGFDGSPESMRERQLEYGAEIGRAVVNFDGPIVFCVSPATTAARSWCSRSGSTTELETVAVEGAHASVIGGAPAAAVVFARDVDARRARRPADRASSTRASRPPSGAERAAPARRARRRSGPRCARRSSARSRPSSTPIHSVERAVRVGSVRRIIAAGRAAAVPDRRRRARHARAEALDRRRWPSAGSPLAR